jgi:activator of HSP90 ATPase
MLITGFLITVMKDYKKYYTLNASPEEVYNALTNAATIQLWSGEAAVMEAVAGTEFSLWEDSIVGKNVAFIPGKKIVQEWYFGEQSKPSVVSIILHEHKDGTSAELRHTNIPDEDYENIVDGWNDNYFGSLRDFYNG